MTSHRTGEAVSSVRKGKGKGEGGGGRKRPAKPSLQGGLGAGGRQGCGDEGVNR